MFVSCVVGGPSTYATAVVVRRRKSIIIIIIINITHGATQRTALFQHTHVRALVHAHTRDYNYRTFLFFITGIMSYTNVITNRTLMHILRGMCVSA